jgi:putative ABC transport system ATP-binding protein
MITLEHIAKRFDVGDNIVTAIDDISLQINKGEFVVVLGPSGSGKTTMLNVISALDNASDGKVIIDGKDISNGGRQNHFKFRRNTISLIFQTFNLFPTLTALENVQFAADMRGLDNSEKVAHDMLEAVGLGLRVGHFPHELSGGEQQRVAIARALATGNPIILADEPTGELDFKTGVQILQLLMKQAQEGKTVVVVTHNREISRIADRVIELSNGNVVSDGPPEGGKAAISELQW